MILDVKGTFTGRAQFEKVKLDEVEIEAHVYSKSQARAEFERFLNATDLPEHTERESKELDRAGEA